MGRPGQKLSATAFVLALAFASIAQERTKIFIGTSAIHSPTLFPLFLAERKGFFKDQGFEIASVYMVPRVQIPALTAKEIPYVTGAG